MMKRSFLCGWISLSMILCNVFNPIYADAPQIIHDPLLVVVLMVKNEEEKVCQTLQPYIDAGINAYLLFDTGSTDNTIAVVQNLFDQYGITNGYIREEPWIDYATSRNRALEIAEQLFPNAVFILMPDAEWYMRNVQTLIDFCAMHVNDSDNSYLVRIGNDSIDFHTQRLIRCSRGVAFVGGVHEVLNEVSYKKVPDDCYFLWTPSVKGKEKSEQRWFRDLELLLKDYQKNPQSPRTVFYLAQTYHCLGQLHKAAEFYLERAMICGWDEENYCAVYRLATVIEELAKGDSEYTWDDALHYYLQAFSMRPHRAEPLVKIAQHYWDVGQRELGYVFIRRAAELPYPKDTLFIEKDTYAYTRYDLLGMCAWYVQAYEIGKEAVLKALDVHPNYPHLHRNLEFYQSVLP